MAKDWGVQMFPVGVVFNEDLVFDGGISLRTWLAAKEYVALLHDPDVPMGIDACAEKAFSNADIFIAEMRRREKET